MLSAEMLYWVTRELALGEQKFCAIISMTPKGHQELASHKAKVEKIERGRGRWEGGRKEGVKIQQMLTLLITKCYMFSNSEFFNSCENLINLYIFSFCCHVQISDTHSPWSALSVIFWAQTKGNKNNASNQPSEKGKLPSSCGYFHSHWEKVYPLVHLSSNGALSFREFMMTILLSIKPQHCSILNTQCLEGIKAYL